jgi:general stress protein YciG
MAASTSNRGFRAMSPEERRAVASLGGSKSSGNFKYDRQRASTAGRLGAERQPLEAKRKGGRNSHRNG